MFFDRQNKEKREPGSLRDTEPGTAREPTNKENNTIKGNVVIDNQSDRVRMKGEFCTPIRTGYRTGRLLIAVPAITLHDRKTVKGSVWVSVVWDDELSTPYWIPENALEFAKIHWHGPESADQIKKPLEV